jgi:hypothetical protein
MRSFTRDQEKKKHDGASTVVFAAVVAACVGSCCRGWCVEGLDLGCTYRTTVLDRASSDSVYGVLRDGGPDFGVDVSGVPSCGSGFDLVAGSNFLVTPVKALSLKDCDGRLAVISELKEMSLLEQVEEPKHGYGALMKTAPYTAQRHSDCLGQWQLDYVSPREAPPVGSAVPGTYPAVLLRRYFNSVSGYCVAELGGGAVECNDYFVISLEPT